MTASADIAAAAVENSFRFEAKKDSLRQLQDGSWTLTVKVHPDEMPYGLLTAAMGTRFVVAACQIGDDETPVEQSPEAKATPEPDENYSCDGEDVRVPTREQMRQNIQEDPDLPVEAGIDCHHYSRQAAMRCDEVPFEKFLYAAHRNIIINLHGKGWRGETLIAETIRRICRVQSRAEFDSNPEAAKRWRALHAEFDQWKAGE